MKPILTGATLAVVLMLAGAARPVSAQDSKSQASPAEKTYQDIRNTLGIVPEFLRAFPEVAITGAWWEMKSIELNPNTSLSAKQKELIGIAVAAQIPCDYCVYFHTQTAKANGATEEEIREAVAVAALTRHWSTYLNGLAVNESEFRGEVDRIMKSLKKQQETEMKGALGLRPGTATNAQTAYAEISKTFGFVPKFMQAFPPEGIAGAWEAFKALSLGEQTSLRSDTKDLISLAVSAQVPCSYCVYWDTQSLKSGGVVDRKVHEAIAMASLTRQWSTVLNGNQIDRAKFREETNQIISFTSKNAKKSPTSGG